MCFETPSDWSMRGTIMFPFSNLLGDLAPYDHRIVGRYTAISFPRYPLLGGRRCLPFHPLGLPFGDISQRPVTLYAQHFTGSVWSRTFLYRVVKKFTTDGSVQGKKRTKNLSWSLILLFFDRIKNVSSMMLRFLFLIYDVVAVGEVAWFERYNFRIERLQKKFWNLHAHFIHFHILLQQIYYQLYLLNTFEFTIN